MEAMERERIRRALDNADEAAVTLRQALLPLGPVVERAAADLLPAIRESFRTRTSSERA